MPPFLPVMGLNRSQDVSIGGQKLTFGKISYVDLCNLTIPLKPTTTVEEAKGVSGANIAKNTQYYYSVTALDAFGGETPAGELVGGKTNNTSSTENNIVVKWTAVPNATGYNVYRGTTEGKEKLLLKVETNKYNDNGEYAEGTATPPLTNNTYYNSSKKGTNPRRELQQHSAIGSYLIVGGPTQSNLDFVPTTGTTAAPGWELTFASEEIKVAEGKAIRQRSTGLLYGKSGALAEGSLKAASGKERYLAVYLALPAKWGTGEPVVKVLAGKEVAKGALTGAEAEAKLLEIEGEALAKGVQLLYLCKVVEGGTPTNVSSELYPTPVVGIVVP